ncbi:phage tail terminator family protein [Lacrimispora defluvii]|uniref:Uncharacterized protein n=1 Tax=Lacrimispora defluvii TaxID=2719233 RepID=A0ABX1W2D0_9FIRM|nr:hypothetical protein [Lacrimispora defluvii]NNJ32648.1 hypothetical protein [Lacrimispora defluvii]
MIEYQELICALNGLLGNKFPDIQKYGNDTTEGWKKPYFFIECIPGVTTYETINFAKRSCVLKITYYQETVNEPDQLHKVEEIRKLIGMKFCVGSRKLDVKGYNHDYVGEYNNILQISVELDWYENLCQPPAGELIDNVDVALKKGEQ